MKQFIALFLLIGQSLTINALEIKINVWERELCDAPKICLPKRISEPQVVTIPEPQMNSFSRVETFLNGHRLLFTYTKRQAETPYISFQTELFNLNSDYVAVCSRFEPIDSQEDFFVGACAGKQENQNLLLGVSLLIP